MLYQFYRVRSNKLEKHGRNLSNNCHLKTSIYINFYILKKYKKK